MCEAVEPDSSGEDARLLAPTGRKLEAVSFYFSFEGHIKLTLQFLKQCKIKNETRPNLV